MSSSATLFGWARRLRQAADGSVCGFEVQQTRNLNHCIPVTVPAGLALPSGFSDRRAVCVSGTVSGMAPVAGDAYLPPVMFTANGVSLMPLAHAPDEGMVGAPTLGPYGRMPSHPVFHVAPPTEAPTDDFVPPDEQFGDDETRNSNRVEICGYVASALLTDGVNSYQRRDSVELMLRLAPPPAHPVQVRLYGKYALGYARFLAKAQRIDEPMAFKVGGMLRIRTKPDPADPSALRRMLYIHCDLLLQPLPEEVPYRAATLDGERVADVAQPA